MRFEGIGNKSVFFVVRVFSDVNMGGINIDGWSSF